MDVAAAKALGAGIAVIALAGVGIGIGNISPRWSPAWRATHPLATRSSASAFSASR